MAEPNELVGEQPQPKLDATKPYVEASKPFVLPATPTEQSIKTQFGGVPTVSPSKGRAGLFQEANRLDYEIGANKMAQEKYKADTEAAIAKYRADESKRIEERVQEVRKQFPYPELHPTQDNIPTLATLFSLIGVIGTAIGGQGKMSAIGAMNAMGGMMKGWQQGRADLWKREKEIFDKEMAKVKGIIDDAYRDADRAYKLLSTNSEEAKALMNQAVAKMGGQVGKQILERQGVENAYKYLDEIRKDMLAAGKAGGKGAGGAMPKDTKTSEQYRARYQLVKNIEDVESLLKDPKYSKLITPTTRFTPELIQNLRQNYPELSQKLARIQALEFEIGGKALTASEQKILEPIYGWRGLTADALRTRLGGVKDSLGKTNALVEEQYPGLKTLHSKFDQLYSQTGNVPPVPQTPADTPSYSVGDIVEKGGKRFKVTGVIKDESGQIIDYDVEEVKSKK